MSDALKPCPFCGGEANIEEAFYDCNHYWAQCKDCKSGTWSHVEDRNLAIAAWNRRANAMPPEVAATIDLYLRERKLQLRDFQAEWDVPIRRKMIERIDAALDWLEQQTKEKEDD